MSRNHPNRSLFGLFCCFGTCVCPEIRKSKLPNYTYKYTSSAAISNFTLHSKSTSQSFQMFLYLFGALCWPQGGTRAWHSPSRSPPALPACAFKLRCWWALVVSSVARSPLVGRPCMSWSLDGLAWLALRFPRLPFLGPAPLRLQLGSSRPPPFAVLAPRDSWRPG